MAVVTGLPEWFHAGYRLPPSMDELSQAKLAVMPIADDLMPHRLANTTTIRPPSAETGDVTDS